MSAAEKNPLDAQSQQNQSADDLYQPPANERWIVAVMGGLLAGILAFTVVYSILNSRVRPLYGVGSQYTNRDPLLMGMVAGYLCFLVLLGCIWILSSKKRSVLFGNRLRFALKGAMLAGCLGGLIGFCSIWEDYEMVYGAGYGGNEDRGRAIQRREFNVGNFVKAFMSGMGTAGGCATFTGFSLYRLYDQRQDGQTSESGKPPKRKPQG